MFVRRVELIRVIGIGMHHAVFTNSIHNQIVFIPMLIPSSHVMRAWVMDATPIPRTFIDVVGTEFRPAD